LKQIWLILFTVLTSCQIGAQNTVKWLYDLETPLMSVEGNYFMGSPTVDNTFIKSYFDGLYLGPLLKDNTFKNLKAVNAVGAYENYKFNYIFPAESGAGTAWWLAVENKNLFALQFNDALFRLFFSGNKPYAGDTILIKDNFLASDGFSQLKAGLIKQYGNDRFRHTFAGLLALNTGSFYNHVTVKDALLFTEPDGSKLDVAADMQFRYVKNTSPAVLKIFNGYGASADFYYNFKCDKGNNFTLSLTDMGFIKWLAPYSHTIAKDTVLTFEGIEISDIFDINASTEDLNKDSIKNYLTGLTQNKSFVSMLPLTLRMYYYHSFSKWLDVGAGMQHIWHYAYKPYYFIDLKFYPFSVFMLSPTFSYGGYAGFNAGLDLGIHIKQFNIFLGSDYLTPFADDTFFRGKGYYFKIVRKMGGEKSSFEGTDHVKISKVDRRPKYRPDIFDQSLFNRKSNFYETDTITIENDTLLKK